MVSTKTDKCEDACFSANERSKGERKGKEEGGKAGRGGKGEWERRKGIYLKGNWKWSFGRNGKNCCFPPLPAFPSSSVPFRSPFDISFVPRRTFAYWMWGGDKLERELTRNKTVAALSRVGDKNCWEKPGAGILPPAHAWALQWNHKLYIVNWKFCTQSLLPHNIKILCIL